ncbi:MAG: hypothetical protein AAF583_00265 [Pseudomonadota bacterium]
MTDATAYRSAPGPSLTDKREARAKRDALGKALRSRFDEISTDKVPEEFLELLRAADRAVEGNRG